MSDYINAEGRTVCGKCQHVFHSGEWPFCPHPMRDGAAMIARDEIPGGFVQEHFGVQPETFYSWSAMRKRADALGLQPFVRQLETIRESDYIDAQTLENARILVSRGSRAIPDADPARLETVQTAVKDWTW